MTTPTPDQAASLAGFDPSHPNIARVYDYLLGGKTNFPADRDLAERLIGIYPAIRQMTRENRRFLVRALDYSLAHGIGQYIDLGSGLPTSPAVHEIARRYDEHAPVFYADNDPVVVRHLSALSVAGDTNIETVTADLTDPAGMLAQIRDSGLFGLTQPACLIMAMVLHFTDAPTARDLVAAYSSALTPGSQVILTMGCGDPAPAIGTRIARAYDAGTVHNHSRADVESFFAGLDLVPPGVTDARAWLPDWPTPAPFQDRAGHVLAGIGAKK